MKLAFKVWKRVLSVVRVGSGREAGREISKRNQGGKDVLGKDNLHLKIIMMYLN